jgi:hypothetical protein
MTQSIPAKSKSKSDEIVRHQRLLELIEAENAANGEVGCGRELGKGLSDYFRTGGILFDDNELKNLLREHLKHILREPDFDSIATQIQRQIESLIIQSPNKSSRSKISLAAEEITEHISTAALNELFKSQLAEVCSEDALEQLIQLSHRIIHKAVLKPRHTWPKPIWVLQGETQIYIAQAAGLDEAIAKVKTQHPQAMGKLEVITAGGILAPDQVISLDINLGG